MKPARRTAYAPQNRSDASLGKSRAHARDDPLGRKKARRSAACARGFTAKRRGSQERMHQERSFLIKREGCEREGSSHRGKGFSSEGFSSPSPSPDQITSRYNLPYGARLPLSNGSRDSGPLPRSCLAPASLPPPSRLPPGGLAPSLPAPALPPGVLPASSFLPAASLALSLPRSLAPGVALRSAAAAPRGGRRPLLFSG